MPHETVLRSLLFLLYINDLPNGISKQSTVHLFADDSIMCRTIKSIQDQIVNFESFELVLNMLKHYLEAILNMLKHYLEAIA